MPKIRPREFALALCLTATAGFLDAVGFLNLGGYFISFMTGNTTRLSTEVVHASAGGIGKALGIIGLFVVGTVIGSVASRLGDQIGATRNFDGRVTVLAGTSAVVGLAAAASMLDWFPVPATLIATVAMGMLNATFLRDGEVSVGLTYMTGTLVKAGQRLAEVFFGGPRWSWVRPFGQWLSLALGAMLGAWAYTQIGLAVLWLVFAGLTATTLATWWVRSNDPHDQ
ncbi:DUF1275 domain-containing protein [Gordonia sp. TBRC 11910]|uniref:DUF1275 domain-containing protein n=1 Tax=Gordonia asplenii TaxID=2725283 RepID=A0A848KXX4_9ACTN|nr:YoaK family protein [Gordonia asplenii]NMO03199.1 DUF1275 domain-containing protein [Gordonia asplenii]